MSKKAVPGGRLIKALPLSLFLISSVVLLPGCLDPDPVAPSNKPPVLTSLTVDPAEILAGQTSTVTAEADDPDGDKLVFEWAADLGYLSGSGRQVHYAAPICCASVVFIHVTVKDGKGGAAKKSVMLLIDQNP